MLTAPGNQTVTIRNNVTTKQTVSLPAVSGVEADGTLIPVSVTVSENSAACFAVAPTYEAGVITYQLADGLDAAQVARGDRVQLGVVRQDAQAGREPARDTSCTEQTPTDAAHNG